MSGTLSRAEIGPSALRGAAGAKAARIAIRNLDFYYADNHALKAINLDFLERQVTGMIGPSGCGKSTLLRVMNRMYDLYPGQRATGEVMMDGQNIIAPDVDLNRLRGRVGMVFQKPTPFPMSIYDNIAFGVKLHERLNRAEMDARGVTPARGLAKLRNGGKVRVAGCVIVRQRPGTAKGITFLSMEDETGIFNVVVMPDLFEESRLTIVREPYLLFEGKVQNVDGVIHVLAKRVERIEPAAPAMSSHDFK